MYYIQTKQNLAQQKLTQFNCSVVKNVKLYLQAVTGDLWFETR